MPMGDYDSEFTNPDFDNYLANPSNPRYQTQPVGQPSQGPIIDFPQPPGGFAGNNVPAPPAAGSAPPSSSSSGSPAPGDPVAFIRSWQAAHSAREGIAPLADAYRNAGFGDRFMYGATPSNNELMVNGEKYKVLSGEDSPDTAGWYYGGDDSAPGAGGGGGGAGASYSSFEMGPAMFGRGSFGTNGEAGNLYDMLMQRARQDIAPDRLDPNIRRASDSNNANLQRAERNYEASVAERAGSHANIGSERRLGMEHVGQASADFENQLMNQERAARRQEVQQALEGARGLLSEQQRLALQEELQRLSIGANESQFARNLGQRAYEFDSNDAFRYSPFASGS